MSRDPLRVRHELTELIQKQIDAIEKETFGGTTEADMMKGGYALTNCTTNSRASTLPRSHPVG